jgi:23S rRNA pseudouridine1911/1915/1917 synthase
MENESEEKEGDLVEHFAIIIDKGQEPMRIDKFLMNRIENASRTKIQAAAGSGNILVNDKAVKSNYRVKPMDRISIVLPYPVKTDELKAENIPLNILYEDDHVIVVNKAAGMVVHPAYGNYSGTLVNALVYHFRDLPSLGGEHPRPGLVHRIDKDTSGILVLAKDELSMAHLARQFFDHSIERLYWAMVWGQMPEASGTIDNQLGRSPKNRKIMEVTGPDSEGKRAITHYRVLQAFAHVSLLECKLETGRTHQIRVHMKHLGHPIFSDETYGGSKVLRGNNSGQYKDFIAKCFVAMPRQALHAKTLSFTHPRTGKRMHFESELPDDFSKLIDLWNNI